MFGWSYASTSDRLAAAIERQLIEAERMVYLSGRIGRQELTAFEALEVQGCLKLSHDDFLCRAALVGVG
jgi:hypothetical protein